MSLVSPQKEILCEPDGSQAKVAFLAAENVFGEKITSDNVISKLSACGVVNHIDVIAIDTAVEWSNKTGEPITDLVAAQARIKHEISFQNSGSMTVQEVMSEIDFARKVYKVMVEGDEIPTVDFKSRFVGVDSVLCCIKEADQEDIFGRKLKKQNMPIKLKPGRNVAIVEMVDGVSFIAKETGYLAIDDQMCVHVISPFKYSADRITISFVILPLVGEYDYKELMNYYAKKYQEVVLADQLSCELMEVIDRINKVQAEGNIIDEIVVAKGRRPIQGKNAEINICVDAERDKHSGETSIIDFMRKAFYTMVKKDELLAEITLSVEGIPGIDVYGDEIPAISAKSKEIKIGDNIQVQESDEKVLLYAKSDGCLAYNNNLISVTDTFFINGDVGPDTGNITHGSSIFVKGNILNGFSVECRNELIVNGSIENNVEVRCGSLVVRKGVFTKKGLVYVRNDADIGYVQEANIRVTGDLTVQRYVYGAKISCRGNLCVLGRGVTGNQRGAVMGSMISVMGSAEIDSVGTTTENTIIACGGDKEMCIQLENAKAAISKLQAEVVLLQKSICIDFSSADAVELLAKLKPETKREVIGKLEEIKQLLIKIDIYKEKIDRLREKAFAKQLDSISIKVNRFIIPKTTFAIGDVATSVSSKMAGMTARLNGRDLKLYKNR